MNKIGVFVCHCGRNIGEPIEVEKVVQTIQNLPEVAHVEDYKYMCSEPGQNKIRTAIKEKNLTGVIVGACSPSLHEITFRRTVEKEGLNPYLCEIANIREQCSWVHKENKEWATLKAIKIIQSMIEKVKLNESLFPIGIDMIKRVLIIGGGISGIQSALDVANAGYEVILVERNPSIGGHMAQLSETFPTLDCSQCIMTPKMVEVGQHEKIKLYTYSEIEEVSGYVGNFKIKIRKKSPFINWEKCNGCGECVEVCPVMMGNEFDVNLSERKAIYRPFPQAVPNKFTIDKRGIPPCKSVCPAGVDVQGYVALTSQGKFKEALELERKENPFPAVCGRVCTHPCESECKRKEVDQPVAIREIKRVIADEEKELPEVKKPPQKEEKVAVIGSGPAGLSCAWGLAKMGYKVTVFEALPVAGGMLVVGIPSFRLPREEIKKDIEYIKRWGVEIKTNSPIKDPKKLLQEGYNAVYIATGAHKERKLGIEGEELEGVYYGLDFLRKVNLNEEVKIGEKVVVVGGGNSAIDAARTAVRLGAKEVTIVYRRSKVEMPANEEEIEEAVKEGIKIHFLATPVKFVGENGRLKKMVCVKMKLGEPDSSGRRRPIPIEGSEFEMEVDTVIPTIGQTPDLDYLPKESRIKVIEKWNSLWVDDVSFETSVPGIFGGGDVVTGPSTVVEAIAQGKEGAISIDRYIRGVDLKEGRKKEVKKVEKIELPKKIKKEERQRVKTKEVSERVTNFEEVNLGLSKESAIIEAKRCLSCGGCSSCGECEKVCEPEAIDHNLKDEIIEEEVGAIILATGYELYPVEKIEEYGAGEYEDVINGLQFERLLSASGPTEGEVRRPSDGKIPKRVVFVSCVGSRDPEHHFPYCSKICCMYTAKHAMLYKHHVPDGEAIVFYIDTRTAGKSYEEFITKTQEEEKVTYIRGKVSKIFKNNNNELVVWGADTLVGKSIEVVCDMVVLSMAITPAKGIKELTQKLKIQIDEHGFLQEAHPKLRPVETLSPGFFLAGCAQAPKDIPDAVAQASGASARVLEMFSKDKYLHDPIVAEVDEDKCSGCGICIPLCVYGAREYEVKEEKRIAKVNEILCEGCGSCVAACPSGAGGQKNFKDTQIFKMIEVVLK